MYTLGCIHGQQLNDKHFLRGLDTLSGFSAIVCKGDNINVFLFALMHIKLLLKKGSTLKGKNLLPPGANSFLLE